MDELTREDLASLTISQLCGLARGLIPISRAAIKSKEILVGYLFEAACAEFCDRVRAHIRGRGDVDPVSKKRKREERNVLRRKVARKLDVDVEEVRDTSKFLQLPTNAQVKACYEQFYQATSNSAVEMVVCAVCAQEVNVRDDRVVARKLRHLPHSERLIPTRAHEAHDLYAGRLLQAEGCIGENLGGDTMLRICRSCLAELESNRDKPPRFSLANNLWIGRIPWQLQTLTFPEQLLIALLYPRIYVFKLYPKDPTFRPDPASLQRGMRGNVSTYDLNLDDLSSMLRGDLLPRQPAILSSVISVTFIGRGTLPKHYLRTIFRVRRQFVFEALTWLKSHNPKYYGSITIDPIRIRQLPEDDVPDEIAGLVRHTTDTGLIDQESAGYVPVDEQVRREIYSILSWECLFIECLQHILALGHSETEAGVMEGGARERDTQATVEEGMYSCYTG